MINKILCNTKVIFQRCFELTFWVSALLLLALISPTDNHYSLCPLNAVGISFCPGCGLGHSISWLFHGNIEKSLVSHPLGIFAVAVLIHRIITLLIRLKNQ
jgi:hypothetical protein